MNTHQNYIDGEYKAVGSYAKGKNSIGVTLGLKDDVIASVEVVPMTTIRMSLGLQKKFAVAISDEVVGRPIDEVHLDKLAGSSLTTQGFNDAVEKIKSEALKQ